MSLILTLLIISQLAQERFTPVEGFADLESVTTPSGFGLLLIQSDDVDENEALAQKKRGISRPSIVRCFNTG